MLCVWTLVPCHDIVVRQKEVMQDQSCVSTQLLVECSYALLYTYMYISGAYKLLRVSTGVRVVQAFARVVQAKSLGCS